MQHQNLSLVCLSGEIQYDSSHKPKQHILNILSRQLQRTMQEWTGPQAPHHNLARTYML